MSAIRAGLGLLGATWAIGAGLAAAAGLIGAVWAWPDALNHFAPLWLCAAWIGGLMARFLLPFGKLRAGAVFAGAFAVFVSGAPIVVEQIRGAREVVAGPPTLTVLTFNRWWETKAPNLEVSAISDSGADVVLLQEADGFAGPAQALKGAYPYQLFCGTRCDTAILSKRPFLASGREDQAQWRPGGTDFFWARTTAADGKPVTLATVHLFWPIPPWIQRNQHVRLLNDMTTLPKDEMVLTGDFNSTPWSFGLRRFDRAVAPLTRRTHGLLTFPATWPLPFLAPDQVFAGPQWRTVGVERLPRSGSDHYPVLVRLRR